MASDSILEIEGVTKHFANTTALDNVSFQVRRGTVTGLLGPNGAGKTTMLRIINNILIPDSGQIRVDGEPVSLAVTGKLGYLPEERGLYDKMRIEDQILYFGQLKGGKTKRLREVMDEYLTLFNLKESKRRRIKELSKGNQQKVQIISTLVHEPELVILDEPFSGFDPINGALLQQLIERLRSRGASIILSSHNMPAIEEMCSDIALIDHGHLLLNGRIDDLKEAHREDLLLITTRNPLPVDMILQTGLAKEITPTETSQHRKGHAYLVRRNPGVYNADLIHSVAAFSDVMHFEEKLPSLNDLFLRYTLQNANINPETPIHANVTDCPHN